MRRIDELITAAPTFAGMSEKHLEMIAGCGANVHFGVDEYLFHEGEPAETFYLIRKGAVALEIFVPGREQVIIETLHERELVGWSWLFKPYRWNLDARVTEELSATVFDGACLRGKCESDHELGYQLMLRFAAGIVDRLQATRLRLLDVYGQAGT